MSHEREEADKRRPEMPRTGKSGPSFSFPCASHRASATKRGARRGRARARADFIWPASQFSYGHTSYANELQQELAGQVELELSKLELEPTAERNLLEAGLEKAHKVVGLRTLHRCHCGSCSKGCPERHTKAKASFHCQSGSGPLKGCPSGHSNTRRFPPMRQPEESQFQPFPASLTETSFQNESLFGNLSRGHNWNPSSDNNKLQEELRMRLAHTPEQQNRNRKKKEQKQETMLHMGRLISTKTTLASSKLAADVDLESECCLAGQNHFRTLQASLCSDKRRHKALLVASSWQAESNKKRQSLVQATFSIISPIESFSANLLRENKKKHFRREPHLQVKRITLRPSNSSSSTICFSSRRVFLLELDKASFARTSFWKKLKRWPLVGQGGLSNVVQFQYNVIKVASSDLGLRRRREAAGRLPSGSTKQQRQRKACQRLSNCGGPMASCHLIGRHRYQVGQLSLWTPERPPQAECEPAPGSAAIHQWAPERVLSRSGLHKCNLATSSSHETSERQQKESKSCFNRATFALEVRAEPSKKGLKERPTWTRTTKSLKSAPKEAKEEVTIESVQWSLPSGRLVSFSSFLLELTYCLLASLSWSNNDNSPQQTATGETKLAVDSPKGSSELFRQEAQADKSSESGRGKSGSRIRTRTKSKSKSRSKKTHNRSPMIDYVAKPISGKCDKRNDERWIGSQVGPQLEVSADQERRKFRNSTTTKVAISQLSNKFRPLSLDQFKQRRHKRFVCELGAKCGREQLGVTAVRSVLLALLASTLLVSRAQTSPAVQPMGGSAGTLTRTTRAQFPSQFLSSPHEERNNPAKLNFWRSLLLPVLSDLSSEAPTAEAISSLAQKLASWPDQKRAALFYLDLLGERRDRAGGGQDVTCRRASLAQLEASEADMKRVWLSQEEELSQVSGAGPGQEEGVSAGRPELVSSRKSEHPGINNKLGLDDAKQFVSLNELNGRLRSNDKAVLEKLNQEGKFADLAKLAVENANLISRLLIHNNETGIIKRIASKQRFFKYLLWSKVRQVSWQERQQQQQQSGQPLLHSLGLVFFDSWPGGRGGHLQGGVSGKLEPTRGNFMSRRGVRFAPLALATSGRDSSSQFAPASLLDLATHPVAADLSSPNGYFQVNGGRGQPFVAKWPLEADSGQLGELERRLESLLALSEQDKSDTDSADKMTPEGFANLTEKAQLKVEDGSWFSPYFDCDVSNTWLMTYSVPFFASSATKKNDHDEAEVGEEAGEEEAGRSEPSVRLR